MNNSMTEFKHHGGIVTFHKMKKWEPNEHTIAYYPLTSSTTTSDMKGSGTAYNLTNYNTVTFGAESSSDNVDCAKFNRNNRLYKSGSLFTGNPTFTVSIREKATSLSYGGINAWGFGQSSSNYGFGIWIKNAGTPGVIASGVWQNDRDTGVTVDSNRHNIIFTYSGGSGTIYLDGRSIYTGTWSPNIQNSYTSIGANASLTDGWYGYLSEAIFEDKARTSAEVSNYYNNTKSKYGIN